MYVLCFDKGQTVGTHFVLRYFNGHSCNTLKVFSQVQNANAGLMINGIPKQHNLNSCLNQALYTQWQDPFPLMWDIIF